jgi:hypothetical protein
MEEALAAKKAVPIMQNPSAQVMAKVPVSRKRQI